MVSPRDDPSPDAAQALSPAQRVDRIATEMSVLAGHLNAGTYRLLELIADFEELGGRGYTGARTTAHYLTWRCGIALRSAQEHVRVALALRRLPRIAAALRKGEISYSKARAVTRVATEIDEDYFLNLARSGTACHVERIVGLTRTRLSPADDARAAARQYLARSVHCFREEDGSIRIHARLPPDQGAVVMRALRAAVDSLDVFENEQGSSQPPRQTRSAERIPLPATRADGLVAVAESFLAHGPEPLLGAERYQVFVHVTEAVLADAGRGADGSSRCDLDDEVAIQHATARRIACDCSRVHVHCDARGHPLDIGRRSRQVPTPLRRALEIRDRGCRFPGCTNHRYVDAHHVRHWADGGETKLANLVLLCRHHHGAIHEAGWSIETGGDGDFAFVSPQGRVLPTVPPPPRLGDHPLATLVADHRKLGLRISSRTIIPHWQGERLDASIALDNLIHLRDRRTRERARPGGGSGAAGSTSTGSADSSDGPPRGSTPTS